jgi:hypothetical protein
MVPYVYLPEKIWGQYANHMKDLYGNQISCSDILGLCKFLTTCDQLESAPTRHDLVITVTDYEDRISKLKLDAF